MVREEERIFNDPGFWALSFFLKGDTTLEYFLHVLTVAC